MPVISMSSCFQKQPLLQLRKRTHSYESNQVRSLNCSGSASHLKASFLWSWRRAGKQGRRRNASPSVLQVQCPIETLTLSCPTAPPRALQSTPERTTLLASVFARAFPGHLRKVRSFPLMTGRWAAATESREGVSLSLLPFGCGPRAWVSNRGIQGAV